MSHHIEVRKVSRETAREVARQHVIDYHPEKFLGISAWQDFVTSSGTTPAPSGGGSHDHMGTGASSTVVYGLSDTTPSLAGGARSFSGGDDAFAGSQYDVVIGADAFSSDVNNSSGNVVLGYAASVGDNNYGGNIAIGYGAAVGRTATGNSSSSVAIGDGAYVGDNSSKGIAIGNTSSSGISGFGSIGIGYGAQTDDDDGIAIGVDAGAHSADAVVIGVSAQATGPSTTGPSTAAVSIGSQALAEGIDAVAIGHYAHAADPNVVAVGPYAWGKNEFDVAVGESAVAEGNGTEAESSVALGAATSAQARPSVALGALAAVGSTSHNYSSAIGPGATTTAAHQIMLGTSAETVHLPGAFKMPTGATNGYVMTSNAAGVGTWQAATGGGGSFGTPALVFSTTNAAGSASTGIRTDATIATFDATTPATEAVADAGAVGSAGTMPRRDHRHPMPGAFVASGGSHAAGFVPDPGSTSGSTKFLREDATWAVPSGGSALTIQELDASPSGTPSTLQFPNGTLTDHGGGVYEYIPASGGRYSLSVASKTTTYTVTGSDDLILNDATSAAFTITLPTASGVTGRVYYLKKTDSSANAVTIGTTSSQTIDGGTTFSLSRQFDALTVASDGTNWQVI